MFALSGLGLFLSAMPAAVYSTRKLAIDGTLFTWPSAFNHFGAHLFGAAMIALFQSYPRRLVRPASLLVLPLTLVPWFVADLAHALPGPVIGMYVPILMQMVTIVGLIAMQMAGCAARSGHADGAALARAFRHCWGRCVYHRRRRPAFARRRTCDQPGLRVHVLRAGVWWNCTGHPPLSAVRTG